MTSFFKASCFIFWFSWLLSFSFLVGKQKFLDNHVMMDDRMESAQYVMNIVCIVNITFAFIGCIFLKCDIHHICCAALYMVCIALIGPGLSIWGAYLTQKNTDQTTPDVGNATNLVKEYFLKHGKTPRWLRITENELRCCGVVGPHGYRALYRSLSQNSCQAHKYDVPRTCCASKASQEDQSENPVLGVTADENDPKRCEVDGSEDWRKYIVITESHDNATSFSIEEKCDKNNNESFKVDKERFERLILTGCYPQLKTHYQGMMLCLYVIFIILTICSFLMLLAYGRSFCRSSYITGEKSDYSLDVETVSLLDLPTLNAHHDRDFA